MGNCSNLEVASQRGDSGLKRDSLILKHAGSLKGGEAFKERYSGSSSSTACPGAASKLLYVRHKDTMCEYVCRRIFKAYAPCQDLGLVGKHLQRLNDLEHPHLCKFVEAFEDEHSVFLIYEKADPTTLFTYIRAGRSFTEDDAAEYTRQMTMALAVAHEQNIVHARLSPSKVIILPERMFDESEDEDEPAQVKICDMGQGLILRETCLQQLARVRNCEGKKVDAEPALEPRQELVECVPPEVAWDEVPLGQPERLPPEVCKLDIWSLGCIVYHMLTGVPPHCAATLDSLVEHVKTKSVEYGEEWAELSAEARDAVSQMLKVNPGLRPTASALLRHPWLKVHRERLPKARLLRLLRNIQENASKGHFKRMVMRVIAQQLPFGSREVANIERAFRVFDRNGDGVLGVPEICQAVQKLDLLSEEEQASLDGVISLLDRDGSSTVNLQEFVAGALNPKLLMSPEHLWYAFNAFDRDGNGRVSVNEIEAIVRQVEAGLLGKEQVDGLVRCIRDELRSVADGDHIDFDEFVYILSTRADMQNVHLALRRDAYRAAYACLGADCYVVRQAKPKEWNWQQIAQSPSSAYRRRGLAAVRRKQSCEEAQHKRAPRPPEARARGSRGKQPTQSRGH